MVSLTVLVLLAAGTFALPSNTNSIHAKTVSARGPSGLQARAGTPSSSGQHDGYYYNFWTDGGGTVDYQNGDKGSFSVNWKNCSNFFGGKGWYGNLPRPLFPFVSIPSSNPATDSPPGIPATRPEPSTSTAPSPPRATATSPSTAGPRARRPSTTSSSPTGPMTRQSTSKSWAATRPTAVSTRSPSIRGSSTRPRARWVPYRPSTSLCVRTSAPAAL
jgi:hypothetical protein